MIRDSKVYITPLYLKVAQKGQETKNGKQNIKHKRNDGCINRRRKGI